MIDPYYQDERTTIYCGDARQVLPQVGPAGAIITDPVWPNCEHFFPGIDALETLREVLAVAPDCERIVIELGCHSDPRVMAAVPTRWEFLRVCWLRFARPSFRGRIINSGDVAYVFGAAPRSVPGARVMPGEVTATKADPGMSRWNWDSAKNRKIGFDTSMLPHPTPRKIQHVKWLVKWFGEGGVIDPFMGSGTTALACKELGVRFVGIEIERRYCDVAIKRITQQTVMEFGSPVSAEAQR